MKLKPEILALLSLSGFEKRFYKNHKISKTDKDAYELTEQEYESNFSKIKYSSYDSFRVTKNRNKGCVDYEKEDCTGSVYLSSIHKYLT